MNAVHFPLELVNIILEYDGQIQYKYKKGSGCDYHKYINIIHKNDPRYDIITKIIYKKNIILTRTAISHDNISFYFEFAFDNQPMLFLCYDYNWSNENEFKICYMDMKGSGRDFGSDQTRYMSDHFLI
tara:strand:+ start:9 stop:392 length:384 start_codon:yes stop_codon:yes gene_type:complete